MVQNKGLIFKKSVTGWPEEGKHLVIETREFDLEQAPPAGGVTTKNYYLSFDPYQRGRMRSSEIKSYSATFEIDKPITNRGISRVIKSDSPRFKTGDLIILVAGCPTEEYSAIPADIVNSAQPFTNPLGLDPKLFVGALGMPGLTAWSSFYEIGEPKKGETIFISSAAGAVGQLVGQLAKHEGLRVIGSVGDDKKLEFIINELGFDAGFNYKTEKPADALARLAPEGIDIYYENVGGEHLEAAITAMKQFGRISKWLHFLPFSKVYHPTNIFFSTSRLWYDQPVQLATRRALPNSQPYAGCGQTDQDARLHR